MERVADWFECDGDGYPTDESIEKLRAQEWAPNEADAFLLHDFAAICDGIACCNVSEEATERYGKPHTRITFSTGGWSGAEDLISAMLSIFWIEHRHTEWKRGGLFVFEVPSPS